ncbi:MAG: cell division protein FtsX [Bacteroidota bacterium]
MSFTYAIREGILGFQRAKLAAAGSILTIMVSLLLLGLFYVLSVHTSRILDNLRSKVEMEAFLEEPISNIRIGELRRGISAVEGVEQIYYVSKEEAARVFKQEFGEDINSVLDFNPLPPSYKIYLKEEYRTPARAEAIAKKIKFLQGIDNVIYRKDMLEFLENRSKTLSSIGLLFGILIAFSSIFLVSNTIRLTISAKRKSIQTMKLVGASRSFVRAPFLIEGILQGLVGGVIASAILYYIISFLIAFISKELSDFIQIEYIFYIAIIFIGGFLGLLGSFISVRRFIGDAVVN